MYQAEIVAIFALTYVGMALGRFPGLRLDRAGIGLLAAIAVCASGLVPSARILPAIDFPTLLILFVLMLVSGKLGVSGFYDLCAYRIGRAALSPTALLALVVGVTGGLSALLTNDVVVFALTPLLVHGIRQRGLDPRPYLIAMAGASNAGSAATVIGNPQNVLIAQVGKLSFLPFLAACGVPALLGLGSVFAVVWLVWRKRLVAGDELTPVPAPAVDRRHMLKGWAAVVGIIVVLIAPVHHLAGVTGIAGLLLLSRRIETRRMLGLVDWPLLVLFTCLFIVTDALASTGLPARAVADLGAHGLLPDRLAVLAPVTLVGSNTIGNVPLVTLLLASWPGIPASALYALAALSTLAGNLLILGSIANIIVVERAQGVGVRLGFRDHAACGVPMTLVSLALAAAWLALTGILRW
jgi:Na+/H+ antiporter NhaD/arsenite permease-like protein